MGFWEQINSPYDLKKLSVKELEIYAQELRRHIIDTSVTCGGHLASNLGAIELTIALHYVFDCPQDKLIFDVGHQCYAHKIITGRREFFDKNLLRKNGGITGFPSPQESEYDSFIAGHSSTSLSVLSGFIKARKLKNENYNVIAVIGDGAFTGGMVYEALNDIGASGEPAIVILNDNDMSISRNVGAVSKYLSSLRLNKRYLKLKSDLEKGLSAIPFFGEEIRNGVHVLKDGLKSVIIERKIFEQFGFKYYGPYDGHNIADLIEIFSAAKEKTSPLVIHLITQKGRGLSEAEHNPEKYHGISPENHKKTYSFSATMGETLVSMANENKKIVAVTAAMASGTGLEAFANAHPERYFDVGIAEQNAVTMCAAMAKEGFKPYFAVYSTFLQRGFDQLLNDVAILDLPVTLLIDRAGVVGSDGVTHQGTFDLSYLTLIPNMTVVAPKDTEELKKIMLWSNDFYSPLAIRYPKDCENIYDESEIAYGKWQKLKSGSDKIFVLAAGSRAVNCAMQTQKATVMNCLFVKPLDVEFLKALDDRSVTVITLEDNVLHGGFGSSVKEKLNHAEVISFGYKDRFVTNLSIDGALDDAGLNSGKLQELIDALLLDKT